MLTRSWRPSSATTVGFLAILLWSSLAVLAVLTKPFPPFLTMALAFSLASGLGLVILALHPQDIPRLWTIHWSQWLLGVVFIFGNHYLYLIGIRLSPPAQANLINYMWPLMVVLMSGLLPGEHLKWPHVVGTCIGLLGLMVLVWPQLSQGISLTHSLGYGFAFGAGLTWALYSVSLRWFKTTVVHIITGYCLGTALLAWVVHGLMEPWVLVQWWQGDVVILKRVWLAVIALGLGPVGTAFFAWDIGMKYGHIQLLGALCYAAPVLSTLLIMGLGLSEPSVLVFVACGLIIMGSLVASQAEKLVRLTARPVIESST